MSLVSQQFNGNRNCVLLILAQCFPPILKLIGVFNFPHILIIFHSWNNVKVCNDNNYRFSMSRPQEPYPRGVMTNCA